MDIVLLTFTFYVCYLVLLLHLFTFTFYVRYLVCIIF